MPEVAIIGAGGKMGSWFAEYFARKGFHVNAYDIRPLRPSDNVTVSASIKSCVKNADTVLVCVPVSKTPETILKCSSAMKSGAVLAEISSVKHRTFKTLQKVPSGIKPLCIHPMFGPGATTRQMKMLLVPVRNEEAERKILGQMFEEASLKVITDAESHDRSMAMVLGLPYFVNVAFAKVLSRSKIRMLKEISGTTFAIQSMLSESVMTDEPDLIEALVLENPFAKRYIREYLRQANKLVSSRKGFKPSLRTIKSDLQEQQDLQQSYKQMYDIMDQT